VLWAAGVAASPAAKWLGAESDRAGRAKVGADLTLSGHREIFVIGDTAFATDPKGNPLPGIAPAAKQAGRYVAGVIGARLRGRPTRPFRYRHMGNLATIGRTAAVVDFGWLRLSGWVAWLLSYGYRGGFSALDHVLASPSLAVDAEVDIVHLNADFAPDRRSSDHDPVVLRLPQGADEAC
jgi:hypothetical protein